MFHLISSFKKRLTIVVWGMIMAFSAASQVELSCGEIVVKNPPNKGEFFDRFGNLYSAADLKAFNYPNDVILEDCESGLFTLQFGLMGNVPAWTMEEMTTVCSTFNYVSGLLSSGSNNNSIFIRITKDDACLSDGAGSPVWQFNECGINNSIIFDQIVSGNSNYPSGFISGVICIRPNPSVGTWHTLDQDCSPIDPCVGVFEADLYTVMLHEALHIVGFASLIGLDGSSTNGAVYSRWDNLLYSTNENDYLIKPEFSSSCCDYHLFNEEDFSNMPMDLSGDCSMNVFIFDGTNIIAEVNNDLVVPANNGDMGNKLSHLDNSCTPGANFVMNPSILAGTSNRTVSAEEQQVICLLGYSGGGCAVPCVIVANDDGPYTLVLSQGPSITIMASELLGNDIFPSNMTIELCGNSPEISIDFTNDIFTITTTGLQVGVFTFCYSVSGCQGWCDEATVSIIVKQNLVTSDCIAPNCNLACFGDFEGFLAGYKSFWPQVALDYFDFENLVIPNLPSLFQELNGNKIFSFQGYPAGQDGIIVPLNSIIEEGCTLDFSFDATSNQFGQTLPALEIYGLTDYLPANGNSDPFCQIIPFQISSGINAICIGSIPIANGPTQFDNNGIITNINLLPYNIQWTNNSSINVSHVLLVPAWPGPTIVDHSILYLDNLYITNSCLPIVSISHSVLTQCIDDQAEISFEICIEGGQGLPVPIDLHAAIPSIPGVTFANVGDFDLNGNASFSLTPLLNGTPVCTTLTLILDVGSNVQPGTQVNILMSEISHNTCIDHNPEVNLLLEDCTPGCDCPPGLNAFNIGNGPQSNLLASETPLAAVAPDGLTNACIAINGHLVWDIEGVISGSHIIMNEGAEIVVTNGYDLYLYDNLIEGCDHMWRSLTCQGGNLTLEGNQVYDAQFAIRTENNAYFRLIDNVFDRNYVGIYTSPSAQLKVVFDDAISENDFTCTGLLKTPYSGQVPEPGETTLAGIYLNDVTGFDIGVDNMFNGIRNGVIANHSTFTMDQCTVKNLVNYFYPFGQAPGGDFNFGLYGVRATDCVSASITNCEMTGVHQGVRAERTNIIVQDNEITADLLYNFSEPDESFPAAVKADFGTNRRANILSNTITSCGDGITLYQWQPAAQLLINDNEISLTTGNPSIEFNGIAMSLCTKGEISDNTVKPVTPSTGKGLAMNTCNNIFIFNNTLYDLSIGETGSNNVNCYFLDNTVQSDVVNGSSVGTAVLGFTNIFSDNPYCCNKVDGLSGNGFEFDGPSTGTSFKYSQIKNAAMGLLLTGSAHISPQSHAKNRWFAGNGGAFHNSTNPLFINFSKFICEPALIPPFATAADQPGMPPVQWFTAQGLPPGPAQPLCLCPYPQPENPDLPRVTADGDDQSALAGYNLGQYTESYNWMTQQRLLHNSGQSEQ
jgi:hypothetical protein